MFQIKHGVFLEGGFEVVRIFFGGGGEKVLPPRQFPWISGPPIGGKVFFFEILEKTLNAIPPPPPMKFPFLKKIRRELGVGFFLGGGRPGGGVNYSANSGNEAIRTTRSHELTRG